MPKVYLYKMTNDNGGAPCVRNEVLSLAICKPAIRTSAIEGDFVLGFAGNTLYENNCLIYAAQVSQAMPGEQYYTNEYEDRPDCIYKFQSGTYTWRLDARFHSLEHMNHDLGLPAAYKRARVLLARNRFRYFGSGCPIQYQREYPALLNFVHGLTQGHRVNLPYRIQLEVRDLLNDVWQTQQTGPTQVPEHRSPHGCSDDEGDAEGEMLGMGLPACL